MKIDIKHHTGSGIRNHQIEFNPVGAGSATAGRLQFIFDGERGDVDWVEISPGVYSILLGERSYEIQVAARPGDFGAHSTSYDVTAGVNNYHLEVRDPRRRRHSTPGGLHDGPQEILAPMPGRIVKILVAENQEVGPGQGMLVIEAMKMQNELRAPRAGRVDRVYVKEGEGVETGIKLLRLT
ncbi:MAG: biotin/lipoyl-containing protein [Terriglobia bacterium]